MKYYNLCILSLSLIVSGITSGCTPAEFGYNAGSISSLTSAPDGAPNGPTTDNNPTLPPGGGGKPSSGPKCDSRSDDDSDSDDDGCKDHDHGKPVEIVPDRPGYCKHPKTPEDVSCDKSNGKKVLICHVPKGSLNHKHTLCIDIHGAVHGHGVSIPGSSLPANKNAKNKIAHAMDYAGPCR